MTNKLYFGDCLDVMREDVPDGSVDLIYLDPPFNSKRLYNAYLEDKAQYVAFDDTWRWHEAVDDFHDVASDVELAPVIEGLRQVLGEGPQLAYLSYMANRLRECRRTLKDTGSIYLHCDPTMSHYLKILMDSLFGATQFRNEIVWLRKQGERHNLARLQMPRAHDIILWYSKGKRATYNIQYAPYSREYIEANYKFEDERGRYATFPCTNEAGGNRSYEFRGITRAWRFSRERMEDMWENNMLTQASPESPFRYKKYLDPNAGIKLDDTWVDIPQARGREKLNYATQKPVALLERIIKASSREGERVMDPFCGCGTTLHAAQSLHRQWIGIDVCVTACKVIERRLSQHFDSLWSDIEFIGMPKTAEDAHELADLDKFRFERWAASLVDGMEANRKQRADGGIDGRGRLAIRKGEFIDIVSQVKGGSTGPGDVQAFNGARQQASADLGIFTCFEERVTPRMRDAAASAGRFMDVPIIQIYTVEDFFAGRIPRMPAVAAG